MLTCYRILKKITPVGTFKEISQRQFSNSRRFKISIKSNLSLDISLVSSLSQLLFLDEHE